MSTILLTYVEALQKILDSAVPLNTEQLAIGSAAGLRLSMPVTAAIDLPRFDNSQMDGYAVRSKDIASASSEHEVMLRIVGVVPAGGSIAAPLVAGAAVKIFTGAPMPPGADTVVPIEEVVLSSDKAHLKFSSSPKPGQFVRCAGEDIHTGQKIARGGDLLTAGRLALISSAGCGVVDVYRRAKVVIVTNGDELTDHSTAPGDLSGGQIYESNGMMLAALARTAGADVSAVLSVADSVDALRETIREIGRTLKPDIILSSGGVSVGDRDYVRHVLAEMGSIVFWRASIRPGKPVVFGNVGGSHFLGLPGNPASSLVTFEIFARPLIAKLQGKLEPLKFFWTVLGEHVSHEPGRQSFVRMCTTLTDRGLVSSSAGEQGSHILSSLAEANSIVVIPEDVSELDAGARAQCLITSPFPFDN